MLPVRVTRFSRGDFPQTSVKMSLACMPCICACENVINTVLLIETRCTNNACFEIELLISNLLRVFSKYVFYMDTNGPQHEKSGL